MNNHTIHSAFPCPILFTKRDTDLSPEEEKEIEDIVKEGMNIYTYSGSNSSSNNTNIFDDGKLKKIKQFCEEHIKIYVEQVINPKEELDFYITQSWLNITKPGERHQSHWHSNSIISGVFYISTVEDDSITFRDPNQRIKETIKFDEPKEYNIWNSVSWNIPVGNNELILFPAWLEHSVKPNEKATTDRISLSFNTFVKGTLGNRSNLNELILK